MPQKKTLTKNPKKHKQIWIYVLRFLSLLVLTPKAIWHKDYRNTKALSIQSHEQNCVKKVSFIRPTLLLGINRIQMKNFTCVVMFRKLWAFFLMLLIWGKEKFGVNVPSDIEILQSHSDTTILFFHEMQSILWSKLCFIGLFIVLYITIFYCKKTTLGYQNSEIHRATEMWPNFFVLKIIPINFQLYKHYRVVTPLEFHLTHGLISCQRA